MTESISKILHPIPVFVLAVLMVWFGWIGYLGSDDTMYVQGALGWLHHFPYVGVSHWTLRDTVVIPIALSFGMFGVGELSLVLPVMLYYFGLLALVYYILNRHFDRIAAGAAVVALATMPLMAVQSTSAWPDFAEVFFCLLSMVLFFEATRAARPHRLLFLAGVAAGFAWLTRETVVFFLVTYGVLFVVGYGVPRRLYFVMAAGFFAVFGIEALYFTVMTGNPLYRVFTDLKTHLKVDLGGGAGAVTGALESAMGREELVKGYSGFSRTGNLVVNRLVDPILAVLANHQFALMYYAAVPASISAAFFRHGLSDTQRRFVRVFGLTGLVWFTFLYLQFGMSLQPRYFILPTTIIAMLFAVWLRGAVLSGRRVLAVLIAGFVVLANVAAVYVDNRDPIFAERSLAEFAKQTTDVVYTDPETARRGEFLYRLAGVEQRIKGAPPPKGALYFYNPKYLELDIAQGNAATRARLQAYLPRPDWKIVWRRDSGRKWSGRIIEALGLKRFLPEKIYERLDKPNPDAIVYRPSNAPAGGVDAR